MRGPNLQSRIVRVGVVLLLLVMAFLMTGCQTGPPQTPAGGTATEEAEEQPSEARQIADATLGKQSEILAQGDLAQNGREQLLVVNRLSKVEPGGVSGNPSSILITRAAILEKNAGKWSEVLRCDEYLKNPNGYLGGAPSERVSGWRLEFDQDPARGLEMRFTPADGGRVVVVRWNKASKRYQSFDQSHGRYLADLPALGAEPSTLK